MFIQQVQTNIAQYIQYSNNLELYYTNKYNTLSTELIWLSVEKHHNAVHSHGSK